MHSACPTLINLVSCRDCCAGCIRENKRKLHHLLHPINKRGGGSWAGSGARGVTRGLSASLLSGLRPLSVLELPPLALTLLCSHPRVNRAKSHAEVTHKTSSLLPVPVPRAEDAGICQERASKSSWTGRVGHPAATLAVPDWSHKRVHGIQGGCRVCTDLGHLGLPELPKETHPNRAAQPWG